MKSMSIWLISTMLMLTTTTWEIDNKIQGSGTSVLAANTAEFGVVKADNKGCWPAPRPRR